MMSHTSNNHKRKLNPNSAPPIPPCFKPSVKEPEEEPVTISASADREKIDGMLVKCVVSSTQTSFVVEDLDFRKFVCQMNPQYSMCSRRSLKRLIMDEYVLFEAKAIEFLPKIPGRISLTLDTWSPSPQDNYMAITAH